MTAVDTAVATPRIPEQITLEVVGVPYPQGDKSAVLIGGKPRVIENKRASGRQKMDAWRKAVADAAREWLRACPMPPLAEPLRVTLAFRFGLPASDPYRGMHVTAPDIDKLTRSTFDALKHGALIKDDSLVCSLVAEKRYCLDDQAAGCTVTVERLGWYESSQRERRKLVAAAARKRARAS